MHLSKGSGLTGLTAGVFSDFHGHKDKSSIMDIIPSGGVIRKRKDRSKSKSEYELMSLRIWQKLLSTYQSDDVDLNSPEPYGMDEEGNVLMQFMPGISTDLILSGRYESVPEIMPKREIRLNFAKRLGQLLKIKANEGLAHGDFQLRHLIQNIDLRVMSVIDVENSEVSHVKVRSEEEAIRAQINGIYASSPRLKQYFEKAIDEGYESVSEQPPVIQDIVSDIPLNNGFTAKQKRAFLNNY